MVTIRVNARSDTRGSHCSSKYRQYLPRPCRSAYRGTRGRPASTGPGVPHVPEGARRVPGLRREEVALLAGVSIDYYVRMERGNLAGTSAGVLEGLARALQLDEAERTHLFDLARAAEPGPVRQRRSKTSGVTAGVQLVLDAITDAPAWIRNARHDMLAANQLARALYVEQLIELIGELATCSEVFRTRWAAHNVRFHRTGHKKIRHPAVGKLELNFEAMEFPAHPGLILLVYTAPKDSPAADGLKLLATWAATLEEAGELAAHHGQKH
ncbi:helix-turn-helix domain-containing protein [Rhodococcus jostii]|uniref:helix-turn-helix domain-containing protein n=1 Tax=Rhodococcus jostii TaxID=132919 RepID=UPI00363A00DC